MKIIVDTREKPHAITGIIAYFEKNGIEYEKRKLDTGDYMTPDNPCVAVDRKQNLGEVANNLTSDNARFMREARRAAENGLRLVVQNMARTLKRLQTFLSGVTALENGITKR